MPTRPATHPRLRRRYLTEQLAVRVSPTIRDDLEVIADVEERTIGAVLRSAIDCYLADRAEARATAGAPLESARAGR
jgi:predicted transcriptional regulator